MAGSRRRILSPLSGARQRRVEGGAVGAPHQGLVGIAIVVAPLGSADAHAAAAEAMDAVVALAAVGAVAEVLVEQAHLPPRFV